MQLRRYAAALIVYVAVVIGASIVILNIPSAKAAEGINPECVINKVYSEPCNKEIKTEAGIKIGGKDCPCKVQTVKGPVTGKCVAPQKCEATATAEGEKPQQADCEGANKGSPGCSGGKGKEDEKGGQPPQMPQIPPPKDDKPPETPKPNQTGTSTGLELMRGTLENGQGTKSDVEKALAAWEPFTKSAEKSVFTNGLDTLTKKQEKIEETKTVDFSEQKKIEPIVEQRREPEVTNLREERYEIPPRKDATGFAPPEPMKVLALNEPGRQNVSNPESGFRAEEKAVQPQGILPQLMLKLRDLLQRLFEINQKKLENPKVPETPQMPWGRVSTLPPSEIKRLENFPPTSLVRLLQSEIGPSGKPVETAAATICDAEFESCLTLLGNGDVKIIPPALGRLLEKRALEEAAKFPDFKYLIMTHDHPVDSSKAGFKARFPDMDVSTPFPEQLLTGPSGYADTKTVFPDDVRYLSTDPRYEITTLLVEPGGLWVGSYDVRPTAPKELDFQLLRKELYLATQSGDSARRERALENFIKGARETMGISLEFLPSTTSNVEIGKAAQRTKKNQVKQ